MPWDLSGNTFGTTTTNFLGTRDAQPLVIKTNSAEAMRVTSDGKVSIGNLGGPRSPDYRLDVQGVLNADELFKGGAPLVESQWTTIGGGITYDGGEVGIGARVSGYRLNVDGVINAADVHKGGAPLVGSQWEEGESGGISYSGGSVGIGTINPSYKLNVNGAINATEFRRNGNVLVGSQWTEVSGVGIRYNALVGLGKAPASPYKLDVAGSINATDIHKNGFSVVSSQWTDVSGGINYGGNVIINGQLSVARPHSDWMFLQQQRDVEGGGGFHVHNPWGDSTAPGGAADRNRLEIAYRTASGQDLWGQFVLHGPTGNVGIGTGNPGAKLDVSGSGGAYQCCAPVTPTLSLSEASNTANRQAWLQFHNWGEAEAYIRLAGGGPAGSGREGLRRIEIGDSQRQNTALQALANSNPIRFSAAWTGFPDAVTNQAEISNDTGTYKTLMIVGNRSAGVGRRVSIWDRLEVNGSAFKPGGGSWSSLSDVRVKKNVLPLKGALEQLLRLRGVSFEWKKPEEQGNLMGSQMGLIAQEVEEVLPEWISTDPNGYKNMTVRGFEALVVEAFKQLNAENETLKARLTAENNELRA